MKKITAIAISALAALAFLCTGSMALVAGPPDLARDSASADVICTGHVTRKWTQATEQKGIDRISLAFLVDRVCKGPVQPGSTITVRYEGPSGPLVINPPQDVDGYILVLLKQDGDSYVFAHKAFSTVRVSEAVHISPGPAGAPIDRLRWEIKNSLQDPSALAAPPLGSVLEQISLLTPQEMDAYVAPLVASEDPKVKGIALSTQLNAGKPLVREAMSFLRKRLESGPIEQEYGAARVRIALMDTKVAPEMLPSIAESLQSKSPEVRRVASFLLRASGDAGAEGYLKPLLDDPDQEVRYNAVMGLAEITGDYAHSPSFRRYKADEATYLGYWKSKTGQ